MGIFRRRRDKDAVGASGEDERDGEGAGPSVAAPSDEGDAPAATEDAGPAPDPVLSRVRGPFDASEVDDDTSRIDLGALRVPGLPGMELRLELDEAQQGVVGATAALAASAVQLQAFAAPRTGGLWLDIRTEIAQSIINQGGTAEVRDGPLGRELLARMPSRGGDGRTIFQPVRFLGVDGPRWFLRAVLSGPAATDGSAAEDLVGVVRGTVVVRGSEAMAPRELLPLRLPPDLSPAPGDEAGSGSGADPGAEPGADPDEAGARVEDLKPFERGPEITEVR